MAAVAEAPATGLRSDASVPQARSSNTAWRRFRRDRVALVAGAVLIVLAALAISAPLIATDPSTVDLDNIRRPPSAGHPLGTDSAGAMCGRASSTARASR